MQTRREFLRGVAGAPLLLSLAPTVPTLLASSAARAPGGGRGSDPVVVVIQLSGGNDGLNTVVPFRDDAYARSRPTLRLGERELFKIQPDLGLHGRMPGMERLFKQGQLAIVQGVGCEGLSRDHEAALRVWQTGYPGQHSAQTGWLGRTADLFWRQSRPETPGVFVGDIPQPLGMRAGTVVVPSLTAEMNVFAAAGLDESPSQGVGVREGRRGESGRSGLLRHVVTSRKVAESQALRFAAVRRRHRDVAEYPDCGLGADLRLAAELIRAELDIRVIYAELGGGGIGGFDNHANQKGNHDALLEQLSDALGAFVRDLAGDGLLDRVVVLTFSEFGRTVAENGRRGTDHGLAGPMFLIGDSVQGGVYGVHPSLVDLDNGALKHHTDFRSVLATVLEDWLGLPSHDILGGGFERLPLFGTGPQARVT